MLGYHDPVYNPPQETNWQMPPHDVPFDNNPFPVVTTSPLPTYETPILEVPEESAFVDSRVGVGVGVAALALAFALFA